MTVTVEELPVVSFFGDELSGCEPLTVNFTNNSSASSGLVDCEWIINGQTINDCGNITYTFDDGGTYDVMLTTTSASGCVNSALYADYIYVEDTPIAAFSPSSNYLTTIFTEVQFENNSVGAVNYDWTFGDLTGTSNEVNPTHQYPNNEGGTYTVQLMAYSPLGCVDSAMATIAVVEELIYYIPNTFTPDGDSYNEYFLPIFTTGYDPYDFEILIYNRWGEVVWESHDVTVGWDGTYGAGQKVVQDGTYTWKIEFKTSMNDERITVSGHVNIIR
jgi:gliding motility-associated-like protein